jgi:F-type H+-transporting ATPase subunit b
MDFLASVGGSLTDAVALLAAEGGGAEGEAAPGFQVNLFWVLTQAVSFVLFLGILYLAAFKRIGGVLEERRARIEQGLRDADEARQERERAAEERQRVLSGARQEANEIVSRAQRVADETRERELGETRAELERVRARAEADIESERQRALTEVRGEIADLALRAAGRVVGETMNEPRERRLVEEFLTEVGPRGAARASDRATPGTATTEGAAG